MSGKVVAAKLRVVVHGENREVCMAGLREVLEMAEASPGATGYYIGKVVLEVKADWEVLGGEACG